MLPLSADSQVNIATTQPAVNIINVKSIFSGFFPVQTKITQPALTIGLSTSGAGADIFVLKVDAITRYFFSITGSADGTTDIDIPISSFQARKRSGDSTYLSIVIPTIDYADEIIARSNGTMLVRQGYVQDGEIIQKEVILETDIEDIRLDIGEVSQSVTLTGIKQTTYSPKTVDLTGAIYKNLIKGKLTYRLAKPYIYLNPGDTVNIEDNTFDVGYITYTISSLFNNIEITEDG